jgi:phosphatidylglycerophosphate synthase
MKNAFATLRKEVLGSVKMIDIEERYDLIFSRPAGLFFAKIAARLKMTPTQVSVLSLIIGCAGGYLFLHQDPYWTVYAGVLAVILAGVLDSSDGQLARMTNQSTELGRIIDGIVDNAVFVSVYFFATVYMYDELGSVYATSVGLLAGAAHSWKSAVYELHKSEYLNYVGGFKNSKLPSPEEVKATFNRDTFFRKIAYILYLDYCRKQQNSGFRKQPVRKAFEKLAFEKQTRDRFTSIYRRENLRMLYWWAWVGGTNVQRAGILMFILLGRFDLYLYLNILSMIPFYFIGQAQSRSDAQILRHFDQPPQPEQS